MCGWVGGGASLARTATELSTTPRPRERGGASQMGWRERGRVREAGTGQGVVEWRW